MHSLFYLPPELVPRLHPYRFHRTSCNIVSISNGGTPFSSQNVLRICSVLHTYRTCLSSWGLVYFTDFIVNFTLTTYLSSSAAYLLYVGGASKMRLTISLLLHVNTGSSSDGVFSSLAPVCPLTGRYIKRS